MLMRCTEKKEVPGYAARSRPYRLFDILWELDIAAIPDEEVSKNGDTRESYCFLYASSAPALMIKLLKL